MSFQVVERQIAYNNAHTIGTGDLTTALVTGYIDAYTAADAVTAGVFIGCKYLSPTTGRVEWLPQWNAPTLPSTTVVTAYLIADPNIVFEIRSAGGTAAAVGIADVGANFEVTVGTVNALTGQSTTTLLNTPDTTATLPLKMIGVSQRQGSFNDPTLVNNIVEVRLNTIQLYQAAGINT